MQITVSRFTDLLQCAQMINKHAKTQTLLDIQNAHADTLSHMRAHTMEKEQFRLICMMLKFRAHFSPLLVRSRWLFHWGT
jgi:hypothetical protein